MKMNRRAMLRGLAGATVGLPILECMLNNRGDAFAGTDAPVPKRYVVCLAGMSLGSYDYSPDRTYVPNKVGSDYDLKEALAPLANHNNIKDEISVVTGLKIPWARENGGTVPSAGRPDDFHHRLTSPLLAGVRHPIDGSSDTAFGPTSDQIVADRIAEGRTLVYRIQTAVYREAGQKEGHISFRLRPGLRLGQAATPVTPVFSPKQAYDALFFAASNPEDAAAQEQRDFLVATRRSCLDLVSQARQRTLARVGVADRKKLEQHFDEVRSLENRLRAIGEDASAACEGLADPGRDPDVVVGYSGEDERAQTFCDIVHMAFKCNLACVASLQFSYFQSYLDAGRLLNAQTLKDRGAIHQLSHSGNEGAKHMASVLAWHNKHFAYLVAKLRDTQEGQATILDQSALVMTHEGGYGIDALDNADGRTHSTENMACLIAGRAGGLRPGRHVRAVDRHPAEVLKTAMKAVGVNDRLGEVSAHIEDLF